MLSVLGGFGCGWLFCVWFVRLGWCFDSVCLGFMFCCFVFVLLVYGGWC